MTSRILVKQCRSFTTSQQRGSILEYFNFKKSTPALPTPSTKEVINKVETTDVKTTRIPIIGKRNRVRENLWKKRMNDFRVERWIPNTSNYKKLIADESLDTRLTIIDKLLLDLHNEIYGAQLAELDEAFELSDLQKRFEFVKKLQIEFGIKISDYDLTKFKTVGNVKKHLHQELLSNKKFNEKEPDAIYLNEEEFKGTNVFISEYVRKGEKEKKFKQLLRQAKKLERLENKKLLEAKLKEA